MYTLQYLVLSFPVQLKLTSYGHTERRVSRAPLAVHRWMVYVRKREEQGSGDLTHLLFSSTSKIHRLADRAVYYVSLKGRTLGSGSFDK